MRKRERTIMKSFKAVRVFGKLAGLVVLVTGMQASAPAQTAQLQQTNAAIEAKVDAIMAKMTLTEKLQLMGGTNRMHTFAFPDAGITSIKMSDASYGVKTWGQTTGYPVPMALAATWDSAMAQQVGSRLAVDAHARGVDVLLAPGVNIYRAPMCGRNAEYMGEDPYLTSRMAVPYILGLQTGGVAATIKHYAANNSEFARHDTNSIVDERTLHEIYLPSFEAAVKDAHVASVMDSYNLINGQHATQNGVLNNEILKKEWGFQGLLMSDWNSTYDGVAAANNGLDLEMPSGKFMSPETLAAGLKAGTITQATIDDHVRRILRLETLYHVSEGETGDLFPAEAKKTAYAAAAESIVLLKNDRNLLPLDLTKLHRIAVLGINAQAGYVGISGSSGVSPKYPTNLLDSMKAVAGKVQVDYSAGVLTEQQIFTATKFDNGLDQEKYGNADFTGEAQKSHVKGLPDWSEGKFGDKHEEGFKVASYRWTGHYTAAAAGDFLLIAAGQAADPFTLTVDGKVVAEHQTHSADTPQFATMHLNAGQTIAVKLEMVKRGQGNPGLGVLPVDQLVLPEVKKLAAQADVVIAYIGMNPLYEGEGKDRPFELLPGQNQLIETALAANPNTIVALNGGGGMDINAWVDQVPALLHTFYGGEEGGHALADVLRGAVNPSGKLPVSMERSLQDDATYNTYYPKPGSNDVTYSEGVFIGYRHFDNSSVKPLFAFGYGLSYTNFAFSGLKVESSDPNNVKVGFDVRNTGARDGDEVAEVYVGEVSPPLPRPVKELKNFTRVHLAVGQSRHVELTLNSRAFSYWDVTTHGWNRDAGKFNVYVGDSSITSSLMNATVNLSK